MGTLPVWEMECRAYASGFARTTADSIRRWAAHTPDGRALWDGHRWWTWWEISHRSDRVALGLLGQGLGRGNLALLQAGNSLSGYIARLALEKAGIQALTLPVTYRMAEIQKLLSILHPQLAIVPEETRGLAVAAQLSDRAFEDPQFRALFTLEASATWPSIVTLAQTAWKDGSEYFLERCQFRWLERVQIATTSGSTGDPKCVEETMGGRMLTGMEQARLFGVTSNDVIAALSPMTSGAADALAFRAAPHLGAPVALVDSRDSQEIIAELAVTKATVAILVPTLLVRLAGCSPLDGQAVPHLRVIVSYGAPLPVQAARQMEARTFAKVVQAYGSVDFGGIAATPVDAPESVRFYSVGVPLAGDEVRILDDAGREQPPGVAGYVAVRGIHATATYVGEPTLTQAAWQHGFYRVGEFGVLDGDQYLTLMGRARDLIIRGGQNIAPAEVEHWLREHPQIVDAAVIGVPDPEMGERIGAVVCLREKGSLTPNALREFFQQQGVALFKCPEYIAVVDALPLVANGLKVDKRALREHLPWPPAAVE